MPVVAAADVVVDVVPVDVLELEAVVVVVAEVADVADPPSSRQPVRLSPRHTRIALSRADTR